MVYLLKLAGVKAILVGLSLFYGWLACLKLVFSWIRYGNQFWYVKERSLPPPCLQDPSLGKHSYVKLKDVKLHYVENGDRDKPLMLLVHGFPEFWFSWRHQLKHFAATHWVVALDLRGYGDSDKPTKTSDYKLEFLEKDIFDVVKALGRRNCTLVGHDWGGVISWVVAAKYPELVSKLIIMNAPHPLAFRTKLQSSIAQLLKSWYIFLFQLPYLPELTMHNDDLNVFKRMFVNIDGVLPMPEEALEAYKYTFSRKGAWTPPMNYYRMSLTATDVLNPKMANLPNIKCPTLFIWGVNDIALEKDLPELTRQYVDNMKIEYLQKGNHFIQNDMPVEVNKAMEGFLQ